VTVHRVKQGECLGTIAARYGYMWQTIYDAPENEALRRRRPNPNVLFPGDEVVIPEREVIRERVATGRQHDFRVPRQVWELRLRLRDIDHEPLKDVAWTLRIEGVAQAIEGKTGGDGLIQAPCPAHARRATLEVFGREHALMVGALDPVSRVTGVQQRLARLGLDPGPIDGIVGRRTRAALRAFQATQDDIADTGRLDDATRLRLQEMCDEDGRGLDLEDDVEDEPHPADMSRLEDPDTEESDDALEPREDGDT
jgi:hypothetical protein